MVTWDDIVANKPAWNTLVWFATLVALADGLAQTSVSSNGSPKSIGAQMGDVSPTMAMLVLVAVFFFTHYLFASVTAPRHCDAAGDAGGRARHSRHADADLCADAGD